MITGLCSTTESKPFDLLVALNALQILFSFSTHEMSTHMKTGKHNSDL